MSERITRVRVAAFRGVPEELSIELPGGCGLVALGENGTGKSTIADALEYYFTGEIRYLAREGRQIISHAATDGDATAVTLETTGMLGGTATLTQAPSAVREVGGQEHFILRGQTLAAFVDMTKGEKWKYLFDILGLGSIEQLRLDLQQARNALVGEAETKKNSRDSTARALAQRCPDLSEEGVLAALRSSCERAGVAPPSDLASALAHDWQSAFTLRSQAIDRARRLSGLADRLKAVPALPSDALLKAWNDTVHKIPPIDRARATLLETADSFLAASPPAEECPLCGQAVVGEALVSRVKAFLHLVRDSARALEGATRSAQRFIENFRNALRTRQDIRVGAGKEGIALPEVPSALGATIQAAVDGGAEVDLHTLASLRGVIDVWAEESLKLVTAAMPLTSPQDAELVNVLRLVDDGKTWLEAAAAHEQAERAASLADQIYQAYLRHQNAYFSSVIEKISSRVAAIYGRLHPEEGLDNVAVEQWGDKGVELAVDFHGHRQRPPHGVLSESHLNSLAIALFLAMAEAFNTQLGVLVLDDVVNSFDVGHRAQLAEMLTSEFSAWQFIILTHDPIFYQRLRRQAPAWRGIEFTSWSYQEGPRLSGYRPTALLEQATVALTDGDRGGASTKARRALEEILQEWCEGMGAPLPFRRGVKNDRRDATELLRGVRRILGDLHVRDTQVNTLLGQIEVDLQAALNIESHANDQWASASEIESAIGRLKTLNGLWTCGSCNRKAWVKGTPGASTCNCHRVTFPPTPSS